MGENLREHPFPTVHTFINYLVTNPRKAFEPSALIVTEKDIPDVSFWQGEIDYVVMTSKTDSIIVRTGQHKYPDPQFERNYTQSRGMFRGLYDFYDDRVSPKEQADRIVAQIGEDFPEMELYIDWERSYGGRYGGLANVVSLMQEIERRRPQIKCGLYTGYYWFRANSNPIAHASQYAYLRTRPLWLAWYTDNPADVLIPAPWTHLTLWQYGTPVEDYGQKTFEIDKNYFNGTLREFYEKYNGVEPVPGEPMYFKIVSTSSNIRSSAGVADNDLGSDNLLFLDIVETEDIPTILSGVTWRKIKRWWRNNLERTLPASPTGEHWAAEKGSGIWMTSTIFNPPPPPSADYFIHFKTDGTTQKYVPAPE